MGDASACVKEHLASAELHGFQMLAPAGHIGRRNSSEQGVTAWLSGDGGWYGVHHGEYRP